MNRPALRVALSSFVVGFVVGGGIWLACRPGASSAIPLAPAPDPAVVGLPPWAWRESLRPPILPDAKLLPAIDAWLALRAADGSPADAATRLDTLRALLVRLPSASFPRLLDPLFASSDLADRPSLTIAFTAWTELDAPAAARWVATLAETPDWDREKLARIAAHAWVAFDPLAASTWACALPDQKLAESFARIALPALARQDPRRAYDLAASRDKRFLDTVLNDILEAFSESDPASALRSFGSGRFQNGFGFWAVRTPLTRWMQLDPAAALQWLADETKTNDQAWFDALGHLARNDPALARSLLSALQASPGLPRNQASLSKLFSYWGAQDAVAALQWLDQIKDNSLRAPLLEEASRGIDLEHPEKALPFLLARADSQDRDSALAAALGRWAAHSPSDALAWIAQHASDPGVSSASVQAHAAILATIALTEPATAAAEFQSLQDPKTKKAARYAIADAWAKTDPGAAHLWSISQNEAAGLPAYAGHSGIFYAWSRRDPVAALRWAEQVTVPASRDFYLKALATSGAESAPRADIADLYSQLKDPALRIGHVTAHLRDWLAKDRPAAKAWLESHDALSPAQAAALLAPAAPQ